MMGLSMKRSRLVPLQVAGLFLIAFTLWAGYRNFASESPSQWKNISLGQHKNGSVIVDPAIDDEAVDDSPEPIDLHRPFNTTSYTKAILDPGGIKFSPLECPAPHAERYGYMKATALGGKPQELGYFFALNLRQSIDILPRLLGSIIEAIRFLGPSACELSIVEGNSDDGTREVLYALQPELAKLNVTYYIQPSALDPGAGERIVRLAELRNLALSPLVSLYEEPATSRTAPLPSVNTTIIFLNDVVPCVTDMLELIHQRAFQAADMTCAMDWTYVGRDPTFYDVWVARSLQGDLFFNIPPDGSWNSAWNLFWNDAKARERFGRKQPFQVFACWNGAVAFGAGPVLGEFGEDDDEEAREKRRKVVFRAAREGECYAGEPTLFCKDLWWNGHGRIAVVPSVNLEYSNEAAAKIKKLKGYASRWTEREDKEAMKIDWVEEAPDMVKCMPGLREQTWRPWNETLVQGTLFNESST